MNSQGQNIFCYKSIESAIRTYAEAYGLIETFQSKPAENDFCVLPKGDQKTGCVGEFWAMRYARNIWTKSNLTFGNPSQHGWDIHVKEEPRRWIQVKTVSGWAEERQISKLHNPDRKYRPANAPKDWEPWTHLWIIYLNRQLVPEGFWEFESSQIEFNDRDALTGVKIPVVGSNQGGSSKLRWPANNIAQFRNKIGESSLFGNS